MKARSVLVTGDYGVEYDVYLHADAGVRPPGAPPAKLLVSGGGASAACRLLEAAEAHTRPPGGFNARLLPCVDSDPASTAAVWMPEELGSLGVTSADQKSRVWRARRTVGLGALDGSSGFPAPPGAGRAEGTVPPGPIDLLVIVDSSAGLRSRVPDALAAILDRPSRDLPGRILLKTGAPIGHGTLWWMLAGRRDVADRLTVAVPVADVRRSDARVSRGISWERTAADLLRALTAGAALAPLLQARDVIVTLAHEGALWLSRGDDRGTPFRARLIFDPARMEGEWAKEAGAGGHPDREDACFVAAVAGRLVLAEDGTDAGVIDSAIERGLITTRAARILGHGPVTSPTPGSQDAALGRLVACSAPGEMGAAGGPAIQWGRLGAFGRADVTPLGAAGRAWRLLDAADGEPAVRPLYGKARRVAVFGTAALGGVPYARFGKLFTADRDEIEALRNLKRLIDEYAGTRTETKPLSLAVFGPPGAGKSFGVKQIAETVIEDRRRAFLEFNLSQFDDPADLVGAFHQVRDRVLDGRLPVVFWDEFDAQDYRWLQYLLAPMQDGRFQEGQITHPIGACIFVFAGATSYTCEHFGPPASPASPSEADVDRHRAAVASFRLKKGPDFRSRLHGFLDVSGPNPRQVLANGAWVDDPADVCFPVRRAILLRSLLGVMSERNAAARLDIDPGLLGAILETRYRHGSRSFEKIVGSLRQHGADGISRAALPTDEVLAMNVDDLGAFQRRLDRDGLLQSHLPELAAGLHARWLEAADPAGSFRRAFEDLPPETRGDNMAAALRIPHVLALAGLELAPQADPRPAVSDADAILSAHIETLAEEEHRGWMSVRLNNGWRSCARTADPALRLQQREARTSDCLVPYADLPEDERRKDRDMIRWYPRAAALAGLKIVSSGPLRP